jgi:putative membrane protein
MKNKNFIWKAILWVIQGCIIGIGAILPGVSGGTLCYVFGIYDQLLEVLSNPFKGIKKYWLMLVFVGLGAGIGFVGFAGITNWLLGLNEAVVLCVFLGLIAGTIPDLWKDAGSKGRNKFSILSLIVSFVAILAVFYVFKNVLTLTIAPNTIGWLICGLLWGLSFIVPGLSSSTLLLFFGIYEAMSAGISRLDFSVLIPLGIAMLATLLLFSRVMKFVFEKYHSIGSHCVMGFVIATTLMILPSFATSIGNIVIYCISIAGGAVASYFFTIFCDKIRSKADES